MLEVSELDVFYGDSQALRKVSIEVKEGEIVTVIGPNGAGKSTLLKAIARLLPIKSGEIKFDGTELNKLNPHQVTRLGLSYVQEGRKIFSSLTVLGNLTVASYIRREKRKEFLDLVFDIFPRLRDRKTQISSTLSGGERQMLCIAMGLMTSPKMLLLDEVSQGLAPNLVEEVFDKILEIRKTYGFPVLLVEQNVSKALDSAERGYILENGRIILEGESSELRETKLIKEAYLGI